MIVVLFVRILNININNVRVCVVFVPVVVGACLHRIGACYQSAETSETKRERMERIGHVIMGIWSLIGVGSLVAGIFVTLRWGLLPNFFISLVVQATANVLVPTIFLTALFHLLWIREHRMDATKLQSTFKVCFHDYCDYRDGKPLRSCSVATPTAEDNEDNENQQVTATATATSIQLHSASELQ